MAPERFKLWPQAHLHTQWPGEGKPGDAAFDQFYFSQMPSIVNYTKQQEINPPAIIALLEKIGPSILLTHSQSGAFAWPVVDQRPDLVRANLAVEPNGPPVREAEFKGAPDWFGESARDKAYRASAKCRCTTIRRSARAPSSNSSSRRRPTSPTMCAAGCRRSRRASSRTSPRCRRWSS